MKSARQSNDYVFSRQFLIALIIALVFAFAVTAYNAINNIVAEQSRIQQASVTPVYSLVNHELLKPLNMAEAFAETINFSKWANSEEISPADEQELLEYLAQLEQRLGLTFFVALEKPRRQYLSSGRAFDLIEGQVYWYFEALKVDRDIIADLGQVGDVHLYFDVRIFNKDNEFLGYVGVGRRIKEFVDTFELYKQRYGYDFLFVNDKDQVILSSIPDLVVEDEFIPPLTSLPWFDEENISPNELDSSIVSVEDEDFLISEIVIEELDWRLLLLVPLQQRQTTITKTFVTNAVMTFLVVCGMLGVAYVLMLVYKRNLQQDAETDQLTQLPNRKFIDREFAFFSKRELDMGVAVIDIDHFKKINDTYGHNVGDEVLKVIATRLTSHIREGDIVGRWGGEEFLMLLPATSKKAAVQIAERARMEISGNPIKVKDKELKVTASFGIAFGSSKMDFMELVENADRALYQAKDSGRNKVVASE
jgi:diguanylate cyclase (GGDEF)-like protein